jgi:hypothetical protein
MKKNIQVIDGALNCTYSIFACSSKVFAEIFPGGADIEFVDDFIQRLGEWRAREILKGLWDNPVEKKLVRGIHGTLFYECAEKRPLYPTKMERDMPTGPALLERLVPYPAKRVP